MKKEPLVLYIFRFVVGLGLLAFMFMLYWSSTLIEEDNNAIRADIQQLRNDIAAFRTHVDQGRNEILQSISDIDLSKIQASKGSSTGQGIGKASADKNSKSLSLADPSLPNLLQEDLFYKDTLPKLLPKGFKPHGTFHNDTIGKPDNLHPFSNWAQVSAWKGLCNVSVGRLQFGKYETLAPEMGLKMEERKNQKTQLPEYWIFLRDEVYWHPLNPDLFSEDINLAPEFLKKHQVTAHDFKFWFDALMNPYNQEMGAVAQRTYWNDCQEVEVIDDLTLVVRWKTKEVKVDGKTEPRAKYIAKSLTGELQPLASFVYKYFADGKKILEDDASPDAYRTSSVWAQNFSQHWAKNIIPSCGAWIFEGMTDRQVSFRRNPDYYFPLGVLAEYMVVDIKDTSDAIWQDFKAVKLDYYNIQPDQLLELDQFLKSDFYKGQKKEHDDIKRLDYLARQYNYIGWNSAKPYFKSTKVRQAMTMAIDRQRIIQEFLSGLGEEITGTFFRNSPSYDSSIIPLPFDLQKARRYLEEDGWHDTTGSGVIDKMIDGKKVPFKFTLTYYVKSQIGKSICDYISTALKEVGIVCNLNGVDIADLTRAYDDKSFDAIMLAWVLGTPPEDPRQLWYSTGAKEKGSSNAVGFANKEADEIIDKLAYEYDAKKRIELYHRFDRILYDEQPYTFLYSPKTIMLYREYLQNVFIPSKRQDLVPGANIAEPDSSIYWLKKKEV